MLSEILQALGNLFEIILSMLGLSSPSSAAIGPNVLRVYIKYSGKTVQVDLNPSWSVKKVKEVVAPKLGFSPNEIKIIFAGNELPDDLVLQTCDVGQQSFLHAVRVEIIESLKEEISPATISNMSLKSHSQVEADVPPDEFFDETFNSNDTEIFSNNGRSDYFIYCNTCEDLREGKLRVRCSVCLSGAFMVFRHPENWDDVLVPNQVSGLCATTGCPSNFAQFYFKCSSHVTSGEDDSSPPLPQVKRNAESVPCLACGDAKEVAFVFQCQLKHVACIDCFKQYSLSKIDQRQFIQDPNVGYTLGCPTLCEESYIKDPHHFKLMGKYQYDRYQRFGAEEYVLQMGGVLCPQPDCGMGIIPLEVGCNKIACLHGCGFVFCRMCLEGWHVGPCPQDSSLPSSSSSTFGSSAAYSIRLERAAQAQWDDVTRRAMRMSTKPCPNCRVATERAGGCMHMECTKCKFQWCWVCQNKWNRECMGNHWFG